MLSRRPAPSRRRHEMYSPRTAPRDAPRRPSSSRMHGFGVAGVAVGGTREHGAHERRVAQIAPYDAMEMWHPSRSEVELVHRFAGPLLQRPRPTAFALKDTV